MKEKRHSEEIHDDAYYDQLIKQRIGEALRNQSKAEKLDLATLEAWVEADRQKRRARLKRGLAIACCFLIVCCGTLGIKYAFDYDGTVAVAGKNDNKVNEKGKNVVVKPNKEGVDENAGNEKITITKWDGIKEIRKQYKHLIIPNYIPESYNFRSLSIEGNGIIDKYTYLFSNGIQDIVIEQILDSNMTVVYEYDRKLKCDDLELLIDEKDGKTGYCVLENGNISISGNISDKEMCEIINNIC